MIYLFRLVMAIPTIATGSAAVFFLLLSIDKPIILLMAMSLFAAFVILLAKLETMAERLFEWWKGFGR